MIYYKSYTIERTANATPYRAWDYAASLTEMAGEEDCTHIMYGRSVEEVISRLDARKIHCASVAGIDLNDHPDFADAHFDYAVWWDTDEPLTESELDDMKDTHPDLLGELAYEAYIDARAAEAEKHEAMLEDREKGKREERMAEARGG